MVRIYYKEKKIKGEYLKDKLITPGKVRYIFENLKYSLFKPVVKKKSYLGGIIKKKEDVFKNVWVEKNDLFYEDKLKGKFYLPKAIVFYDERNSLFPKKFYFITQINEQIELRECNGENVEWFEIPEIHKEINDNKILQKIKNSFAYVLSIIESENIEKEIEERPILSNIEKEAYQELCKLCITNNQKRKEVCDFFGTLKSYENDENYYTTLNFVTEFLETNDYQFIMRMDNNSDVENLEWLINNVLEANYKELNIDFPKYNKNDDYLTVSSDNVFESFSNSLKKHNLQLGFIDTKSDEYISIIHKIEDKNKIKGLIRKIGYEYFER